MRSETETDLLAAVRRHRLERYGGSEHVSFSIDRRLYEAAGLMEPVTDVQREAAMAASLADQRERKAARADASRG